MIVWHHALPDEGGDDATDGGAQDGEVVERGTGSGGQSSLGALCPLRGAPAGPRLSAWLALRGRAQELLAVGRSGRAAAWLAWIMCALSIVLTVLSLWLLILNLSHPNVPVYLYWAEDTLLAVGYSTVGAVAASHRPGNPVGWVLCSIGLCWGVAHLTSEYATYALLAAPGSLPAAEDVAWIYSWIWVPGLGVIVFLPLLLPNGRLPSPRWRPFAWLSVLL